MRMRTAAVAAGLAVWLAGGTALAKVGADEVARLGRDMVKPRMPALAADRAGASGHDGGQWGRAGHR